MTLRVPPAPSPRLALIPRLRTAPCKMLYAGRSPPAAALAPGPSTTRAGWSRCIPRRNRTSPAARWKRPWPGVAHGPGVRDRTVSGRSIRTSRNRRRRFRTQRLAAATVVTLEPTAAPRIGPAAVPLQRAAAVVVGCRDIVAGQSDVGRDALGRVLARVAGTAIAIVRLVRADAAEAEGRSAAGRVKAAPTALVGAAGEVVPIPIADQRRVSAHALAAAAAGVAGTKRAMVRRGVGRRRPHQGQEPGSGRAQEEPQARVARGGGRQGAADAVESLFVHADAPLVSGRDASGVAARASGSGWLGPANGVI